MAINAGALAAIAPTFANSQVPPAPPAGARRKALPAPSPTIAPADVPADIAWGSGRAVQAGVRSRLWSSNHYGRFIFEVYLHNRTGRAITVTCPAYYGLTVAGDGTYTTLNQSDRIYCKPRLRDSMGETVKLPFRMSTEMSHIAIPADGVVLVSHWMLSTIRSGARPDLKADANLVARVAQGRHTVSCFVPVATDSK
ncbi:MAG TPA: hypothetical protein VKT77_06770, partial [Chthonomonadaceae bacterium]|nr:hypothetical protein [Chthonomonadaceae bacterium]